MQWCHWVSKLKTAFLVHALSAGLDNFVMVSSLQHWFLGATCILALMQSLTAQWLTDMAA